MPSIFKTARRQTKTIKARQERQRDQFKTQQICINVSILQPQNDVYYQLLQKLFQLECINCKHKSHTDDPAHPNRMHTKGAACVFPFSHFLGKGGILEAQSREDFRESPGRAVFVAVVIANGNQQPRNGVYIFFSYRQGGSGDKERAYIGTP